MEEGKIVIEAVRLFMEGADPGMIEIVETDFPYGIVTSIYTSDAVLFFSYKEMLNFVKQDKEFTPVLTKQERTENLFNALVYEVENFGIGMKANVLSQEV